MPLSREKKAALMGSSYIRKIMEHEEALQILYSCFASAFPKYREFWEQIAQEELRHKQMTLVLDQKTKTGEFGFRRPDYLYSNLVDSIQFVTNIIQRVETKGITMREALATAVKAESNMLESKYMEVIHEDSESAKRILGILRQDTESHLKKIKKEAGKFKWHVLGGKTCKPSIHFEINQKSMIDEAKQAQLEILECLVSLEESLSTLYNTYQTKLDDYSDFWAKIATEEMQHAAMLKTLYPYLQKGNLFQNIGRFNKEAMIKEIDNILDIEYSAKNKTLTMQEALHNALKLETQLAESSFYSTVESASPEFKVICERMTSVLHEHKKRLQDKTIAYQKEKKDNVEWI